MNDNDYNSMLALLDAPAPHDNFRDDLESALDQIDADAATDNVVPMRTRRIKTRYLASLSSVAACLLAATIIGIQTLGHSDNSKPGSVSTAPGASNQELATALLKTVAQKYADASSVSGSVTTVEPGELATDLPAITKTDFVIVANGSFQSKVSQPNSVSPSASYTNTYDATTGTMVMDKGNGNGSIEVTPPNLDVPTPVIGVIQANVAALVANPSFSVSEINYHGHEAWKIVGTRNYDQSQVTLTVDKSSGTVLDQLVTKNGKTQYEQTSDNITFNGPVTTSFVVDKSQTKEFQQFNVGWKLTTLTAAQKSSGHVVVTPASVPQGFQLTGVWYNPALEEGFDEDHAVFLVYRNGMQSFTLETAHYVTNEVVANVADDTYQTLTSGYFAGHSADYSTQLSTAQVGNGALSVQLVTSLTDQDPFQLLNNLTGK